MTFNKKFPTKTYTRNLKRKDDISSSFLSYEIPTEYENACRLCLGKTDIMYDIFSDINSVMVPLVLKIKSILSLEINEEDQLPTSVCDNCLHQLDEAYTFKTRCLASDTKLRQFLLKPNPSLSENDNINCEDSFTLTGCELLKDECTIEWDDQVPLASIIITENETQLSNRMSHPIQSNKELNEVIVPMDNTALQNDIVTETDSQDNTPGAKNINEDVAIIDMDDLPLEERYEIQKKKDDELCKRIKKEEQSDENEINASCSKCRKTLRTVGEYRIHKVFCRNCITCPICSKTFACRSLLIRHNRVHTGERPFTCDLCDRGFSQKEILHRHIAQVHTDNRQYKCPKCTKCFSMFVLLSAHVRTTHSGRKFKCRQCPKVFQHASGLSRHQNYHNGTVYFCKICFKKFTDASAVSRHLKIHNISNNHNKHQKKKKKLNY